jgi:hypothetical protein
LRVPAIKRSLPSTSSHLSEENQNQKKNVTKVDAGKKPEVKGSRESATSSSSEVGAGGKCVERAATSTRGLPRVEERLTHENENVIDDNKKNANRIDRDEGRKLRRKADFDLSSASDSDVEVMGGPISKARGGVEKNGGENRETVGVTLGAARDGGDRRESKEMSSNSNHSKKGVTTDGNATDFYESDADTDSKMMSKSKRYQSQSQTNTHANPSTKSSEMSVMASPVTLRRSQRISELTSPSPLISCDDTDVTGQISKAKASTSTATATFKSGGGGGKRPKQNARQFFLVVVAGN